MVLLLLLFKEVKSLNIKILYSLFLFRGKVPKVQGEDSESDKFIFLKNDFVAGSPQKCRARKAFKKSPKKKLKIRPAEPLAFSKANRQKGKAAMIAEADGEVIIGKAQLKRKIKCLYYSETPAELIKAFNSKKELKNSIFSVLY